MNRWRESVVLPLVLALGCAQALADDKSPVNMEVWSIRATTKNSDISPELKGLANALKQQFKYTGFKLEKRSPGRAPLGKSFSATLIGGYQATVTPKSRAGKKIQLQVVVSKGGKAVINTTFTVEAGKLVALGAGPLDGGDYLISAVRAR